MRTFFLILLSIASSISFNDKPVDANSSSFVNNKMKYSYLALGDSYTIGESVLPAGNFPHQVASLLKNDSIIIDPLQIIATTGWTTDELNTAIDKAQDILLPRYDFVSLLIGVNNQYRGRPVENYRNEFEQLLKRAIQFAGGNTSHVVVVSIPDWGVTPFAKGRDSAAIAAEIDAYNTVNKQIAAQYHVHYIDITPWTREARTDLSLLAGDGLHPSGKEYQRWAMEIAKWIKTI